MERQKVTGGREREMIYAKALIRKGRRGPRARRRGEEGRTRIMRACRYEGRIGGWRTNTVREGSNGSKRVEVAAIKEEIREEKEKEKEE